MCLSYSIIDDSGRQDEDGDRKEEKRNEKYAKGK